jgi:hypothetical protein
VLMARAGRVAAEFVASEAAWQRIMFAAVH